MKNLISLCILFSVLSYSFVSGQSSVDDPEARLKEVGVILQTPPTITAIFLRAVRVGNIVYLSGHGPQKDDGEYMKGKVGSDLNLEEAQAAARLTGIRLLEALKEEIGNLRNVKRIVKVLGMVNAVPTFDQQSQVINGFSELMVEAFGENGRHARSAVGVGSLPMNIPCEIEMIVELKQ